MRLYEINEAIAEFMAEVEAGSIPLDAIDDTLEALNLSRDEKIDNTASLIKSWDAEIEAICLERKRLQERERVLSNKAQRLRDTLATQLDGKPFKNSRHVLSWRKSTAVEVAEDFASDIYAVAKTTYTADKTAIKQALQAGKIVKGARLVETQNLQIK